MNRIQQLLERGGVFGSRRRHPIFISYRRRGEGAGYAGRLAERLTREFGEDQCFRDIDDIETGTDFVEAISEAVGSCRVLVVIVAPDWLNATDANGQRRLDDPRDFVRLEIAAALERNTRVIPVLVAGAVMPAAEALPPAIQGFGRRQAHELSDLRWDYDVEQLVASIERMGVKRVRAKKQRGRKPWAIAAAFGGAALVVWGAATLSPSAGDASYTPPQRVDTVLVTSPAVLPAITAPTASEGVASKGDDEPAISEQRAAPLVEPEPEPYNVLELERPLIIEAMRRANEAEIHALHELDATPLYSAFTGSALEAELASVTELIGAGLHSVSTLHDQQIESMQLGSDGNSASVVAVERWSSEFHSNQDDTCMARLPIRDVRQTVTLVRSAGSWLVAAIDFASGAPEPVPCE